MDAWATSSVNVSAFAFVAQMAAALEADVTAFEILFMEKFICMTAMIRIAKNPNIDLKTDPEAVVVSCTAVHNSVPEPETAEEAE